MPKSAAERAKNYRERVKKDPLKYEASKAKARAHKKMVRKSLTVTQLAKLQVKEKTRQKKCRLNKKKRLRPLPTFKSRQSFGKSLKKLTSVLSKCDLKKKAVVRHLAQKYGLLPKDTHQRTSLKLSDKLKKDIHQFYIRDDISIQLPDKCDTVILKDELGVKTTGQKRVLITNLGEIYEQFKEEKKVDVSRSSFADLRPGFVVPKVVLAHRICVCLYHENVNLLIEKILLIRLIWQNSKQNCN
ncbi:unnamed protein product [Didymodactylos carnosus]|uniref:Uncharacterized protein n=1 Tax=Didymodactylos carnosus TaxID=1234261 RepID=A0A8S2F706_9BILA|nr:unnamed protein product [Didymodactylos carnosus]CAF4176576.1 unnamed protein product [Didymodactylos carnosus]